jgi:hypothetical protein
MRQLLIIIGLILEDGDLTEYDWEVFHASLRSYKAKHPSADKNAVTAYGDFGDAETTLDSILHMLTGA